MIARLLRDIREEVIGLLFNRHVFRTHQEIVRLNPQLQGRPRSIFAEWSCTVYAVANAMGVRRLASGTSEAGDVNLVRLLDMFIANPGMLWTCFELHHSDDAARARTEVSKNARYSESDWQTQACKRLLGEDRKALINVANRTNLFASKRAAHSVPDTTVRTTFSDLDEAIDILKKLTEKYTLLVCSEKQERLKSAHEAGDPTIYTVLAKVKNLDLLQEMKNCKLPEGWKSIFLEPWATSETVAYPLGDMSPPMRKVRG